MLTELRLAQYGMGMQEGTVVTWHKQEGDSFAPGELLVEVEAAKTTVEIEADSAGKLVRIVAQPNEVVEVGGVLAQLDVKGEAGAATAAAPKSVAPAKAATPDAKAVKSNFAGQAEPRARRLAEQKNVNLAAVTGTGPSGRILEADVQAYLDGNGAPDAATAIPLKGLRGTIARRLLQSVQTTAQLTLISEVDVTALEEARKKLKAGTPITFTEMLVVPVSRALRQHPILNATLENDVVTPAAGIHIGIAVQADGGLVVPVLHDADKLAAAEVSGRFRPLASAAREGTADAMQMSGGTFSITNLGAFGIDAFTPILNTPQVAILGVGRVVERYTRSGAGAEWRKFVTLSLTFDHRAVDGVPAAEFLQSLSREFAAPDAWLGV